MGRAQPGKIIKEIDRVLDGEDKQITKESLSHIEIRILIYLKALAHSVSYRASQEKKIKTKLGIQDSFIKGGL